jgi:hypothetical protein
MTSNNILLVMLVIPMNLIAEDKVWKREVKTMEEQCDLKKGLANKGSLTNPKGIQGPKAPYAEGSFSSATYRESVTSALRRRHEEAFGISTNVNTNLINVVTNKVKVIK